MILDIHTYGTATAPHRKLWARAMYIYRETKTLVPIGHMPTDKDTRQALEKLRRSIVAEEYELFKRDWEVALKFVRESENDRDKLHKFNARYAVLEPLVKDGADPQWPHDFEVELDKQLAAGGRLNDNDDKGIKWRKRLAGLKADMEHLIQFQPDLDKEGTRALLDNLFKQAEHLFRRGTIYEIPEFLYGRPVRAYLSGPFRNGLGGAMYGVFFPLWVPFLNSVNLNGEKALYGKMDEFYYLMLDDHATACPPEFNRLYWVWQFLRQKCQNKNLIDAARRAVEPLMWHDEFIDPPAWEADLTEDAYGTILKNHVLKSRKGLFEKVWTRAISPGGPGGSIDVDARKKYDAAVRIIETGGRLYLPGEPLPNV